MLTNAQLVKKAPGVNDFVSSDLSSGGALLAEQAARFIRTLRVQPTLLNEVRLVEMNANTRNINKVQFASAILKPGVEGTALAAADRSQPTTSQVVVTTKEVVAEVRLPYDVIEDNIERGNIGTYREGGRPNAGGGFMATILTLMAARAAEDMENVLINADTVGSGLLGYFDGVMKLATSSSNIVDVSATISKGMFKDGMKTLPDQYLGNRASLRNYVSQDQEIEYRDTVADRATGTGDTFLAQMPPIFAFGVPVRPVSYMPENQGLLTDPRNLIWGIQRDIHLEIDKEITERNVIMVLSAKVGIQVEELDALVKYINISTP